MQHQPLPKRSYWQTQQHTALIIALALGFTCMAALVGWGYAHIIGIVIGIMSALILQSIIWAAIIRVPFWLCQRHNIRPCERLEVLDIVNRLARHSEVARPRVYEIQIAAPNMFSFGLSPNNSVIVVTSGLMEWLNNEELIGVVAHEIAHIKYRHSVFSGLRILLSAILPGALYIYSKRLLRWILPHEGITRSVSLLNRYANTIAIKVTRLGMSPGDELHADAFGATVLTTPLPLISALEKIEWATQRINCEIHPTIAPLCVIEPQSDVKGIALPERISHLRTLSRLSTLHTTT
ncbi:MAG: M48 family metalloprotease [Chloroflexota bacterium]